MFYSILNNRRTSISLHTQYSLLTSTYLTIYSSCLVQMKTKQVKFQSDDSDAKQKRFTPSWLDKQKVLLHLLITYTLHLHITYTLHLHITYTLHLHITYTLRLPCVSACYKIGSINLLFFKLHGVNDQAATTDGRRKPLRKAFSKSSHAGSLT